MVISCRPMATYAHPLPIPNMYIAGLYKAVYYIYNLATRKLEKLSDGGPQRSSDMVA